MAVLQRFSRKKMGERKRHVTNFGLAAINRYQKGMRQRGKGLLRIS